MRWFDVIIASAFTLKLTKSAMADSFFIQPIETIGWIT